MKADRPSARDPIRSLDGEPELGDAEQAKLHAAIEQSLAEIEAGQTVPFAEVIASLRVRCRAARGSLTGR